MADRKTDENVPAPHDRTFLRPRILLRIALALGTGTMGGAIFSKIGMPIPWMLGALIFNTLAVLFGAPVLAPNRARPYVVGTIGVMLGAGFTPDILDHLTGWVLSILFLAVYLVISGLLVVPYYVRFGRFDAPTAYFSGMPGGLVEMMIVGKEMGGNDRQIILAHASRMLVTVLLIALWFRFIAGLEISERAAFGVPLAAIPVEEIVILALCGVAGFFLGRWLRLPAPMLAGPMLLSAVMHITGHVENPPPRELINIAQVVLGTIMGCRFLGSRVRDILHALLLGTGATLLTLSVTLAFALLFHEWFGQTVEQVLLAYAPGGVVEMSLIALAMGAEVDYVALHHIARITIILVAAAYVFRLLRRFSFR